MSKLSFEQLFAEATKDDKYWEEEAKLEFVIELNRIMKKKNISKSQLADKIGTSRAYMTKVFSGKANFTMSSMVKISRALGTELRFQMIEEGAKLQSFTVFNGKTVKTKESAIATDWAQSTVPSETIVARNTEGYQINECAA